MSLTAKQKEEFALQVRLNMKRAYFSALGLLGNHDAAMDASQEAFVRAYNNYEKYDTSKKFFTWYYKILKNLCLNVIRDNAKFDKSDFLETRNNEETVNSSDEYEKKEMKACVEKALLKLNAVDRGIIMLREYENYSYKEIAEIMDIPSGTVMSRLYYARKKLYSIIKDEI